MTRTLPVSDPRTQHAAFIVHYLDTGDGSEAAKRAGLAANDEDAQRVSAILLGSPRIQKRLREEVQARFVTATPTAFASILALSKGARNESVRLQASKEIIEKAGIVTISRSAVAVGVLAAEDLLAALEAKQRGEPIDYLDEPDAVDAEFVESPKRSGLWPASVVNARR